ncbi:MAG: aspartyl-tRNA(Asn)/glutamyl-tRNA (Gln) amidotransferase subunit A [Parcubacteria group bacterium Athens1014_10]|nr:MAG: aspartyl-tRNA(Asn)/glutamyl-tRNA (Gln) amidotransferase subunit A [Parcubacteria group bacterium Athens1014_10]TSD05241.1 MAG: aspartyl-tRNA(Asn)/glutamyl-tRNA (Gln) amidotransferase subunit A [Parcubacteria group bacterium Athens0714_12]
MMLNKLTIKQAHQGLIDKKFSSLELTEDCLSEIKKRNKKINAFISIDSDLALEKAKEADKKIGQGVEIGVLEGIPLAIKDNILIEGIKTTAGSKILENYIAPYDATVIKKLKNAGAIFLGKTNMDEFAMGSSTENSYFGPTKNPRDLERVPGGSSGGSAAAVAANFCLGALGSDTGGSIRQPASFCGIVGFKPTYGCVSRYGLMAMASSLDQIGPLTKNVEDAEILFHEIKGRDGKDSTSIELNSKLEIKNKFKVQGIKIGIPKEYFIKGMDKEVEETLKKAIKKFENLGAKIEKVSLPHTDYALACYYIIMPSEVSSNLARYDGIKYGYSAKEKIKDLLDVYLRSREKGFGDEARRRIMLGTYSLSSGYYEAYYLQAQKIRALIKKDFVQVFNKVDCLIAPTSPTIAFKIGEKIDDPLKMYLSDIFTISANLAGLPAISLPCGLVNNLPAGLQIIGNQFEDEKVLAIADIYERSE